MSPRYRCVQPHIASTVARSPCPGFGEGVLDPRRHGRVHLALDEPVALQHAKPPATLIGVAALDVPEHLVEVEVTAVFQGL
jgi:hypothetical protein